MYVVDSPTNYTDQWGEDKKCCGVSSFQVNWSAFEENNGNNAAFAIKIDVTFKSDAGYDPKCCEHKQVVTTKWKVTSERPFANGTKEFSGRSGPTTRDLPRQK